MNIKEYTKQLVASLLVFIGLILISQNYSGVHQIWNITWPMFLLIPGTLLIFEAHLSNASFSRKFTLWVGTWLVLLSLVFIAQIFTAWAYYQNTIFLYPLTIPASIMLTYSYKKAPNWLRTVVWVWVLISIITFLIGNNLQHLVWALLLILAGAWLLFSSKTSSSRQGS